MYAAPPPPPPPPRGAGAGAGADGGARQRCEALVLVVGAGAAAAPQTELAEWALLLRDVRPPELVMLVAPPPGAAGAEADGAAAQRAWEPAVRARLPAGLFIRRAPLRALHTF